MEKMRASVPMEKTFEIVPTDTSEGTEFVETSVENRTSMCCSLGILGNGALRSAPIKKKICL